MAAIDLQTRPSPLHGVDEDAARPGNSDAVPPRSNVVFGAARLGFRLFLLLLMFARTALVMLWRYLRYHPLHAVVTALLAAMLLIVIATGSKIHKEMILLRISDQVVDQVISASRFTREYNSDTLREFLNVGGPVWAQREAVRAVLFHARKAGLPIEHQAVLLATVEIESGFNPMARADTTSACGLFQFVKKTGEAFDLKSADCMNPWANARAGVEHFIANYERTVRPEIKDLTGAERLFRTFELSYYLHHDGPYSTSPSNDVKAIVLTAMPFLFKVQRVLETEATSAQDAPTFAEEFTENLLSVLHSISNFFNDSGEIPLFRMGTRTGQSTVENS